MKTQRIQPDLRSTLGILTALLVGLLAGCASQAPRVAPSAMGSAPNPTFFRISDVHFDPFFGCSDGDPSCSEILGELFDASTGTWRPGTSWDGILSAYCRSHTNPVPLTCAFHMANRDRDTNYFVFDHAMRSAAAVNPRPSFVIETGDFLAHDFRSRYDSYSGHSTHGGTSASAEPIFDNFVDQTIVFVASKIKNALGVEVYAALGNNDAYCGDYLMLPNSGFLSHTAQTWKTYFAGFQSGQETNFLAGGYFRVDLKPAHRVLVLNTVIYTERAQDTQNADCDIPQADRNGFDWDTFDVTQPPWAGVHGAALQELLRTEVDSRGTPWIDTQFGWLIDELVDADAAGQVAWLAAHVPPGLNGYDAAPTPFLTATANDNFAQLLSDDRFAPTIAGFLAGHTHENEFKLSRTNSHDPAAGIVLIAPAIDSDHDNQPAYQVYDYDPSGLTVLNHTTYATLGTTWPVIGQFRQQYSQAIKGCGDPPAGPVQVDAPTLTALFDAMLSNCEVSLDKYGCNYASLAYSSGACGALPQWCGGTCDKAYKVSVSDLLGTFPRTCQ